MMSAYVSISGVHITLESDSCVCTGCYLDFIRNHNEHNVLPRWKRILNDVGIERHCVICCTSRSCDCARIQQWGPSTWNGQQSVEWWGRYFMHKGMCTSINSAATDICRVHMREFERHMSQRVCCECSSTCAEKWYSSGDQLQLQTPVFNWVWNICMTYDQEMLQIDLGSDNNIAKTRAEIIAELLQNVRNDSFVYISPFVDRFKSCLNNLDNSEQISSYVRSFKACVDKYLSTNGYKSYCSVLKLGKLYFDDKVHTIQGIEHS